MKKKLLSSITLLCMAMNLLVPIAASAEEYTEGQYTYIVANGEATIKHFHCKDEDRDIVVPETLGGYPVTAIGNSAFAFCSGLTSITLPDTVTSMGNMTFDSCDSLEKINIPEGVTEIGYDTFYRCVGLKEITLPSTITSIGDSAFSVCLRLENVNIPEGVENIGFSAFTECDALERIAIPSSIVSIGECAFANCDGLEGIEVHEDNEYYSALDGNLLNKDATEFLAYAGGKANETFTIPYGVTKIANGAFYSCDNLTKVSIPETVTEVGANAFYGCERIIEVEYTGTLSEWVDIEINTGNEWLINADICCLGDYIDMPTPTVPPQTEESTPPEETDIPVDDEMPMPTPPMVTPPVEMATASPVQYPDPLPYSWKVSSEYNGCPAGTELMAGLTTLFDNICTNGKYISGSDSGNWSKGTATGLALRYAPTANGVLTVSFIDLGSQKSVVANIEGGEKNSPLAVVANDGLEKISGDISIEVEAGKVYYVYGAGTKARLTAASFELNGVIEETPTPSPTAEPTVTSTPICTSPAPDIATPEPTPGCTSPTPDIATPEPTPPGGLCTSPAPDITTPEPTPDCVIPPICIEPSAPTDEPVCTSPRPDTATPESTESPSTQPGETGSVSGNAGSGSQADEIFAPYYLTIWESDENGCEILARAEDISGVVVYAASYDGNGRLIELQSHEMKEASEMIRYDMPILKEGYVKVYMWRGITSLTEIKFIKILSM